MTYATFHLGVIHPLWPAGVDAATESSGASVVVWIGVFLASTLVIGGLISWFAWRDRQRNAPVERAFRAMARRMRLGRQRAELVRVIAEDRDIPPVALLISQTAFDNAVTASSRGLDPQSLAALRHHLFGEH